MRKRRTGGSPHRKKPKARKAKRKIYREPVKRGTVISNKQRIRQDNLSKGLKTHFLPTLKGIFKGVRLSVIRFTINPFKKS